MGKVCHIIHDKCVGCGLCARNCPTNSITITDRKAAIGNNCVGCNICLKICPKGAVEAIQVSNTSITCNSCPVHCNIPEGCLGSCQRFRNENSSLIRIEPLNIVDPSEIRINNLTGLPDRPLLLGYGAGTNLYSTNVPAKIIAGAKVGDMDVVSCVTETVLSFNGARVKVDTDENIGSNGSPIRRNGVIVGYVNTAEYGSRMLYFGGAELNTGDGGFMVTRTVSDLLNKRPVTVSTDTVKKLVLQHGAPPIIDGKCAQFMRIGCGSMVSSAYSLHWMKVVDECITIDYDITAKMSTHTTSGLRYGLRDSGITPAGIYSSPGRWFGEPGPGWGGSNIMNPEGIFADVDKSKAWPGMRVIVTEPTVERAAYFEADEACSLVRKPIPPQVQAVIDLIHSNCEPCLCSVSVCAGFGGGARNVISKISPILVNNALKEGKILYTICGQPVHIWEGGGITAECSVEACPDGAFSWVPTPAGITPMEVTMSRKTYEEIGGYMEAIRPIEEIQKTERTKTISLNKKIKK